MNNKRTKYNGIMIKSIALIAVAIIVVGNIGAQEALAPGGQAIDARATDTQVAPDLKNWETVIIWQDATVGDIQNIDVTSRGRSGNTPLHRAVQKDASLAVVDELLQKGETANVKVAKARDTGGSTPLHWAARYAKSSNGSEGPGVVTALLARPEVQVDARDRDANTPLYLAVLFNTNEGIDDIITQLMAGGAKVDILDDQTGETLLHKAVRYNTNPKVIDALLASNDVKIDTRDNGGNTALHNAIRHDKGIDIIRKLAYDDAGGIRTYGDGDDVVVDAKDLNSVTPLDLLKEHEVLSYLYYEISDDLIANRAGGSQN